MENKSELILDMLDEIAFTVRSSHANAKEQCAIIRMLTEVERIL